MIRVRVPATSANMGAGFDSMGIALGMYNILEISEIKAGLQVICVNSRDYVPKGKNNLVYRAMKSVFDTVGYQEKGLRIVQRSEIPVTRGLGSSSACIIGGMLAANVLSGRKLSYREILDLAVSIEGHPDNVTPALYGGFCAAATSGGKTFFQSMKIAPHLKFAVMIPDYFVATNKSRGALPENVAHKDAAFNIAHAVLFAMSLVSGNAENLREGVRDRMHQPYRSAYIDGMEEIFEKTYELGARATYLSGSGPTILSVLDDNYEKFRRNIEQYFYHRTHRWRCRILSVDNVGAVLQEIS